MRWKWFARAGGQLDQWPADGRLPLPDWALERTQLMPELPGLDDLDPPALKLPTVRLGEW